MDRQFNCRVLLADVQHILSNDERTLLHFIIGNIVSTTARENKTLGGTLNIIESLFQQEIITEDNLDFLIKCFDAINCKIAVSRLKAFQSKRRLPSGHQLSTSVLRDNYDDDEPDKIGTNRLDPSILVSDDSIVLQKLDEFKPNTTDPSSISSEAPVISNQAVVYIPSRPSQKKIYKSPLTLCLSVLFLLNILLLVIYLSVFFRRTISAYYKPKKTSTEVYLIQRGAVCNYTTEGEWLDHAQNQSLTFNEQLKSIEIHWDEILLCSIKFRYSETKYIEHKLKHTCPSKLKPPTIISLNSTRNIKEIIQSFHKQDGDSVDLQGLSFRIPEERPFVYGSNINPYCTESAPTNHTLGYALSKRTANDVNGFQFVWYKSCSVATEIQRCMNDLRSLYVK